MSEDRCVCCGEIVPEGRMVCPICLAKLKDAPTILRTMTLEEELVGKWARGELVEPKKGKWVRDEFGSKCSCCGLYAYRDKFEKPWESNYCPNCGADMREEKTDE